MLKRSFKPEFLNRLDEIVFYTPLTKEQITQIMALMLRELDERLADRHLSVVLSEEAKEYAVNNGYDPIYGARPLKRFRQSAIETPIARLLIAENVPEGSTIYVDCFDGEISVSAEKNGE